MEVLNLHVKISSNKLLDLQDKLNSNMKKVYIQIVINKILLLIYLQYGQSLKVVPIKTIKFNLYINLIRLKFLLYSY